MHKLKAPDNGVDFDFFQIEEDSPKLSESSPQKYSSKIITKAVIETKPKEISKTMTKKIDKLSKPTSPKEERTCRPIPCKLKTNDCASSPTSSEEKRLLVTDIEDVTLFNCLAYNDDINDGLIFNTDEKYYSDNSLSDSTITTVTSDFTTVSRLSSVSDSSCGSELSTESPAPQVSEPITKDSDLTYLDIALDERAREKLNESNDPEELVFEPLNTSDPLSVCKYLSDDHDNDVINFSTLVNGESDSNNANCSKDNSGIHTGNISEQESSKEYDEDSKCNSLFREGSMSAIDLEERLGSISIASHSSSNSNMTKAHIWRGQNRFRSKKRELNLTFSREELIRIERDNTILLKKIMSYSKPRSVMLNHTFSHKKTSAAINRARQQKKIEQDNYILYSKINAMNRMKKVF